jgi:hypothetical protein
MEHLPSPYVVETHDDDTNFEDGCASTFYANGSGVSSV